MLQVIDDRSKVSGYLRKIYSYYVTAATLFLLREYKHISTLID